MIDMDLSHKLRGTKVNIIFLIFPELSFISITNPYEPATIIPEILVA